MKKIVKSGYVKFFILFVFAAMLGNAMAQEKDGKTKPFSTLAVANEKMNVLYAGLPNPIRVAASVNPKKLRIDWGGATAIDMGLGRYDVYISDFFVGRDVTITVYTETKKGEIQNLEKYTLRVKSVPEPNVFIGEKIWTGEQYKDTILANPFISAKMDMSFNYDLPWKVLSYRITFITNRIKEEPIIVCGASFSEEVINKIKNAPHGTLVEFSKIRIKSLAGCYNIPSLRTIRIIETEDDNENYDYENFDYDDFDYDVSIFTDDDYLDEDFDNEDYDYNDCDDE